MEETKALDKVWTKLANKAPIVISGPCSAETEEQLTNTATQLAKTGRIDMLRAGIWKPRTKPGNFEGVGAIGLPWLQKAKALTGLPISVEVANASHVEEALNYGIDLIWIGARTTTNPFSVQEIADTVKGLDIPVFIKNPINPDLQLWIGAIERIEKAGIKKIGAIHRGFSSYGNTEYRNAPMWHIPIELKRMMPQVPLICDPSHICGRRNTLKKVAQEAANLDYNGLMLEAHVHPDEAWSDAQQQITPEQLDEMIQTVVWRHESDLKGDFTNTLAQLREQTNQIDDEILTLLGHRMKVAEKVGLYKREHSMTILQTNHWNKVLEKAISKGKNEGLTRDFIIKYLDAIHLESIHHQNRAMNNDI